jgi:hypothetical protein
MKKLLFLLSLLIGFSAFGQNPIKASHITLLPQAFRPVAPTNGARLYNYNHFVEIRDSSVYSQIMRGLDSLIRYVTPTQLTDSLNIVRDTTNDHYPRIVALESKALSVQNIWVKDADSTVSSYYPVNLSAFRLLPDSRYITESISVRNAPYRDTLSMSKVIGDRRIDMDYGVSDGAGGLLDYGKKIDGSLSISGNITAANLNNFFETELTVDSQNNLAVGFILPSTAKVFYNGWIIPTALWSGEGTTTLTLALDTRKYDTVIITN